jgi:hypothetical protein
MFNYADAGGFHLPPGILAALARFGTALSRTVQYNIAAQLKATTIQATIPVYQNSVSSISLPLLSGMSSCLIRMALNPQPSSAR